MSDCQYIYHADATTGAEGVGEVLEQRFVYNEGDAFIGNQRENKKMVDVWGYVYLHVHVCMRVRGRVWQ